MSKIFESLNREGGDIADVIRPMVDGQSRRTPDDGTNERVAVREYLQATIPIERPFLPTDDLSVEGIRTLKLRVPAPSPLLPFDQGGFQANEQYRILRTKIAQHRRQPHLIMISSPDSGDGKSVTAVNVAAALSLKTDVRTLLIDADLRNSAAHIELGLPEAPGLAEVLQGISTLDQALVRTEPFPNLYVLTGGMSPANPAELLDSGNWLALCARVRKIFRFVIVDSPPVAAVADYHLIEAACDGVILIVRPDHTNRGLLLKTIRTVPEEKMLGAVMNCVPKRSFSKHSAAHYYRYPGSGESPVME